MRHADPHGAKSGVEHSRPVSYPSPEGGTWSPPDLRDRVAVVTGATRGVGRGIAEVLGQCGATVYVTGRSTRAHPRHENPEWSVDAAAEAVTALGGHGIAAPTDHADDAQVEALFERIRAEHGHLDVLVSNVVGNDESWEQLRRNQFGRVWRTDVEHWDQQMSIGVRSNFVAARFGLPLMLGRPHPLLVFTGERPNAPASHPDPIADLRAHATARMAFTFAAQLADEHVTAVHLAPGDVITHVRRGNDDDAPWKPDEESVFYSGRAVAALAADPDALGLSGQTLTVDGLAERYGFTDIAGSRPDPNART